MIKHIAIIVSLACLSLSAFSQEITLEDIWKKGTFRQESVYGVRSMEDGLHYTTMDRTENGTEINKYSYESGEKLETILSEEDLRTKSGDEEATIGGYRFSSNEKFLLISFDVEHIYRHSTIERYYIVDLDKGTTRLLEKEGKQRHATFSPDGVNIAYVKGNDLFVQDYKTSKVTQVTTDGKKNSIINGYADWVYEEEFAMDKAFFWSPDGSKIAFYRTDESGVKEYNMQKFTDLYPEDYLFKYPKAGEDNARVAIKIYDLKSAKTAPVQVDPYEYIPRIKWTQTSDFLAVMTMPRLQNKLEILLVETSTLATKSIYNEESKTYIEISDDLTFFGDNAGFIWKSEKDGYFHLYKYDLNGKNETQLTSGKWEVRDFAGYDAVNKKLFFTASMNKSIDTELYSLSIDGGDPSLLGPATGSSRASFSKTFDYFILYHNDANTPQRVTLHDGAGKEIRMLKDNSDLKEKMEGLELSDVSFFDMTTSENVKLNGWMMKPANFDKKTKYPVLMFVYGGPGSQTVTNAMSGNYWWHQYLCQQGYIVVSIDNRGTGARGRDFRTQTYGQLGKLETLDQIEGAKWLAKQDYVDAGRIGIWGWSYGGYMSSLCLMDGADVFKTAIAVAPVTNWRFYDSIYTERYMGLPQDNPDGYDDNSPINHVETLEGKYLLVHGTGDDNVHYQNSVEMIDALVNANKQFDFAAYPERNHGIYGGNTRLHLFTKMSDFISSNL
jgi:dipeptidyl-peptidase 4